MTRLKIGIMADTRSSLRELEAQALDLERRGFDTLWVPQVFGVDAITASAVIGHVTSRIEVGTAVVPTQPRHPLALAQRAGALGMQTLVDDGVTKVLDGETSLAELQRAVGHLG